MCDKCLRHHRIICNKVINQWKITIIKRKILIDLKAHFFVMLSSFRLTENAILSCLKKIIVIDIFLYDGGIIWSTKILNIYDSSSRTYDTNSYAIYATNNNGCNKGVLNWGNDHCWSSTQLGACSADYLVESNFRYWWNNLNENNLASSSSNLLNCTET